MHRLMMHRDHFVGFEFYGNEQTKMGFCYGPAKNTDRGLRRAGETDICIPREDTPALIGEKMNDII